MINIKKYKIILKVNDFYVEKYGILKKNILLFEDNNIKYSFNFEKLVLIRENNEFLLIIDFINKNYEYILKESAKKICNNFIIKHLLKEDTSVIIKYRIEENEFCLFLSYKEVKR